MSDRIVQTGTLRILVGEFYHREFTSTLAMHVISVI
jgi:hypothetical protein